MAIYFQSGVNQADLFDTIVDNINGNGWTIAAGGDKRTTGPGDFFSIQRQSPVFIDSNDITTSASIIPQAAVKDEVTGVIYLFITYFSTIVQSPTVGNHNVYGTVYRWSSLDGITFTSPSQVSNYTTDLQPLVGVTPQRMVDGKYWMVARTTAIASAANTYFYSASDPSLGNLTLSGVTATTPNGDTSAAPGNLVPVGNLGKAYVYKTASNSAIFFYPMRPGQFTSYNYENPNGTYYIRGYVLTGSDLPTAIASPTQFDLTSSAAISVKEIYGVDYILDQGDHYDVYITCKDGSDVIGTKHFKTDNYDLPTAVLIPQNGGAWVYTLGNNGEYISTSLDMRNPLSGEPETLYAVDRTSFMEAAGVSDTKTIITKSLKGTIDGNPDFHGLEYEYVVLESDKPQQNNGDGYFMMMLQLNPNQAAPPSIADLNDPSTGTYPIFMRPLRNWSSETPDRFFFDPSIPVSVDPTTDDAFGPCILSVPNPGGSAETHKLWLRVTSDQVFAATESSLTTTKQYMHYNVAEPVVTLKETPITSQRNDNVAVISSGSALGAGAIALGWNGEDESSTTDTRNNGAPYYPLGAQVSYATVLSDTNSVDGFDYAFDTFFITDTASLDVAASLDMSYVTGKLVDTLFFTNATGLLHGNDVTFNTVGYKFFSTSSNGASHFAGSVPTDILIRWD